MASHCSARSSIFGSCLKTQRQSTSAGWCTSATVLRTCPCVWLLNGPSFRLRPCKSYVLASVETLLARVSFASCASRMVKRKPLKLKCSGSQPLQCAGDPFGLANATGGPRTCTMLIYVIISSNLFMQLKDLANIQGPPFIPSFSLMHAILSKHSLLQLTAEHVRRRAKNYLFYSRWEAALVQVAAYFFFQN